MEFILQLFKGKNVLETVAKILIFAAGAVAMIDKDKKGVDDALAVVMGTGGDALQAYAAGDTSKANRLIDSVIAGLTRLKQEINETGARVVR